MNVIEMKNISKSFPGTKAVDAVDFRLEQGEILSLLGENGAGKTTLMKILYGMHSMDTGEIFFKGRPVEIKNLWMPLTWASAWYISTLCWFRRLLWRTILLQATNRVKVFL